ncbi:hypothetical protein PAXRUDRAFT_784061 [Paxillus rubicundulus Ve08.2h10]|uniref:Uncharacterized protein n=1 Tax=Paxillus rubicundulus Ve08.2h10 TaxID=930991 RepID=A0A0D0EDB7_9AGAM|nr:hypothetical protein PAXRUDRAFT_784061 [Paxillus rubicundulus Ve08.2h10]
MNVTNQDLFIVGVHLSNFVVPEAWLNGRVFGSVQIYTPLFFLSFFSWSDSAYPHSTSSLLFTTHGYFKTPKLPFFLLTEIPPIPEDETAANTETYQDGHAGEGDGLFFVASECHEPVTVLHKAIFPESEDYAHPCRQRRLSLSTMVIVGPRILSAKQGT